MATLKRGEEMQDCKVVKSGRLQRISLVTCGVTHIIHILDQSFQLSIYASGCRIIAMLLRLIQRNSSNRVALMSYDDSTDDWVRERECPPSQQTNDDFMAVLSKLEMLDLVEPKTMVSNTMELNRTGAELIVDDPVIHCEIPDRLVRFLQPEKSARMALTCDCGGFIMLNRICARRLCAEYYANRVLGHYT